MSAPLPEELPPNFEFGPYIVHDCIGRGGMARVYRAQNAVLRKPIALKVLDRWVLEKPGGADRFLREARTAASIKHPNVVDIVDVGVWSERPYIVMELLNGNDLDSELERRGALAETEVVGLALPIISGMMAVHDAGVVHRDIKPSNIFLAVGSEGEIIPKVLDFGVSKISDQMIAPVQGLTKTREIVGTPTYMAPEALNGARELGPRADQYALGAVLYDCAVGRPPFEGETLLELLKAIAVGNVPAPRSVRPELSIELDSAIMRAMSSDPAQRFDTLRDLGRALWPLGDERTRAIWERSFSGRALGSSREQTTRSMPGKGSRGRRGRTQRKSRWLAALVAAAGVLGGSYWFYRVSRSSTALEQVSSLAPRTDPGSAASAAPAPAPAPADDSRPNAASAEARTPEPVLAEPPKDAEPRAAVPHGPPALGAREALPVAWLPAA